MKRAFLFGLGTYLILVAISGLLHSFGQAGLLGALVALVTMPISVVVIRAARRAPPNRSRLHAVFGWLLGFLVLLAIGVVIGVVLYIFTLVKGPALIRPRPRTPPLEPRGSEAG
jgi:predicted membrane metal-binding protein